MNEQEILTLDRLQDWVSGWVHHCEINHIEPSTVEVIIKNSTTVKDYRPFSGGISHGSKGTSCRIEFYESDIIKFEPVDTRPEIGEYWKSRGTSTFDVSGFITSKAAGLRLLRMVRYILDTDEPKTWLDYREYEPNWIQFKFSAEEFDVVRLSRMAQQNNDIITEEIIRACKK